MAHSSPAHLTKRHGVDGVSRWQTNIVVSIATGGEVARKSVKNQAEALGQRHNVIPINWIGGALPAFQQVDYLTRVYLVAHGTEGGTTLAGLSGTSMASNIADSAKLASDVGLVSLVCCYAGKEATGMGASLINTLNPSFGRSFHFALGDTHGIYTVVHARSERTMVYQAKYNKPGDSAKNVGRKMVMTPTGYEAKKPGQKYRYYWRNGVQVVESVY